MAEVTIVIVLVLMSINFFLGMLMMKMMNGKGFSLKKSDLTLIEHRWGMVIGLISMLLMAGTMLWLIQFSVR